MSRGVRGWTKLRPISSAWDGQAWVRCQWLWPLSALLFPSNECDRVGSIAAGRAGADAASKVSGERRLDLRDAVDRVVDGPEHARAGALGPATDGPNATTEADGPRELGDEEVTIAGCELDTDDVVVRGRLGDVFLDLGEAAAVRVARLLNERGQAKLIDLGAGLFHADEIGGGDLLPA